MGVENLIRALLFAVFFSIGAAVLGTTVLCDDLIGFYHNRALLEQSRQFSDKLRALIADYDALLEQLDSDPNLIKRIAPAALGTIVTDANTVYPKATAEALAAAREALAKQDNRPHHQGQIPVWLQRCTQPRRRIMLFACGAALVLISLTCFTPPKPRSAEAD